MTLSAILQDIVDGSDGAVGAALMGLDGIPIEQAMAAAPPVALAGDDVTAAGIEFGRVLSEMHKASRALGGGAVQEAVISVDRLTFVLRMLDEESFVALVLVPDGNLGKARYHIRRHLLALREEL